VPAVLQMHGLGFLAETAAVSMDLSEQRNNRRILVVDDMSSIHEDFRKILAPAPVNVDLDAEEALLFGKPAASGAVRFEMDSAHQGSEALEKVCAARLANRPYAMAFVDMRMAPGWDGVETIERLWQEDPQLQIVVCSAFTDYSWMEVLSRLDVRDRLLILKKPFDPIEVYQFANALTMKWQMTEQAAFEMGRLEQAVKERTQALEQSREMFRLMAESTKAVPFTLDLKRNCFPYIGPQAIADSGVGEAQWKLPGALDVVMPRDTNPDIRQRFDECQSGPFEFVTSLTQLGGCRTEVRWNGTCEWVEGTKYLRGLMLDISELRRLGRELAAAQKLESIGRLAAGVAHEINTPVQFVTDSVQFVRTSITDIASVIESYRAVQRALQTGGDVAEAARLANVAEVAADIDYIIENSPLALDSAVEGLGRVATIVRSMKQFAHPDQAQKTHADLNQAIQGTIVIANNEYKYVALVETDYGDLPPVQCYLGEINQVVLNLLVNAAHAIGDVVKDTGGLGKLTVRTRCDGNEVEIAIGDTGTGIPEAVRSKIFDPFFTTKEVGKGTGQGLALARSIIVNKHGGTLRFETSGKGTTFFIRLPIEGRVGAAPPPTVKVAA
jgi:two-component system NtrC family sensor kinase